MRTSEMTSSEKANKHVQRARARTSSLHEREKVKIQEGVTVRRNKAGVPVTDVHYSAVPERNPEINPDWKRNERKVYPSQASWDREQEIIDEAGGGELVFADTLVTHWDKIIVEDPKWRPDPKWRVEGGFDHGKTNPTALIRCYVDYSGTIWFAGEYYMPGQEVWQHASQFREMPDIANLNGLED